METWANLLQGAVIAIIGFVIGALLSFWVEPQNVKGRRIAKGLCIIATIGLAILITNVNPVLLVLMVEHWPVIGMLASVMVGYCISKTLLKPLVMMLGFNHRGNLIRIIGGGLIKESKRSASVNEPGIKSTKDAIDKVFDGREEKESKDDKNLSEKLMEEGDAYRARTYLMSPTERKVFKALEKDYGEEFYIFCQVRVVDIIQPNMKKHHSWTKEYQTLFRQLSQWHFDYVFCTKEEFRIVYAVELDDPSHEQKDRVKRDRILNQACQTARVTLIRVRLDDENRLVQTYPQHEESASRNGQPVTSSST